MENQYDGFIYQWINVTNNKKYIGSHLGKTTDYYTGSGLYFKRAYKKNPGNFKREILEYFTGTHKELQKREEYYLSLIPNIAKNKEYYNLSASAGGGRNHDRLSKKRRKEIIKKAQDASLLARKNMSREERELLKKKKQNTWEQKNEMRTEMSEKTRKRRLKEEASKTIEQREEFKIKCKESYWNRSEEDRVLSNQKRSDSIKEWHKNKDPSIEERRIQNMTNTKKLKKLRYINNGSIVKQVPEKELINWISEGWQLGMGKRGRC